MNTWSAIACATIGSLALFSGSCAEHDNLHSDSFRGRARIDAEKDRMRSLVNIGDNIFTARKKLESSGFSISYGPELSNAQKTRYLMIVSYGVAPGPSEYFLEAMEWKRDGKSIYGVISADKSGRIFRIE